jgi:hypothetical protein
MTAVHRVQEVQMFHEVRLNPMNLLNRLNRMNVLNRSNLWP